MTASCLGGEARDRVGFGGRNPGTHSNHDIFYVCLGVTPYEEPKQPERQSSQESRGPRLPWWLSGWEATCQGRGYGFDPWLGKRSHATEQLSPCATTTEPTFHNHQYLTPLGLEPVYHDEEWPPLAVTRESLHIARKTQCSQKRKKKSRGTVRWADIVMNPVYR